MPRQRRFTQLHSCHHVMLRGNGGQTIFIDDADRIRFSLFLQKAIEEHQIHVHAFCLMRNHVHLILEPTTFPLSAGIHALAGRYAQYFNRRQKLRGHLFQDRFRSILIEDDSYLMRLARYIHLNPIRANLTKTPQDFRWSSYCAYLALDEITWLTHSRVLQKFGTSILQARQALQKYTFEASDAKLDVALIHKSNQIGILGGEEFIEQFLNPSTFSAARTRITLEDLITTVCTDFQIDFKELLSQNREKYLVDMRSILALVVRKTPGLNLEDLAQSLYRNSSSLYRLAQRAVKCSKLSEAAEKIVKKLGIKDDTHL